VHTFQCSVVALVFLLAAGLAFSDEPMTPSSSAGNRVFARFPTIPAEHKHVHALAENAMRYVAPQNRIIDAASGYPVEGWNQDPKRALFLRSFTQLTAIGQWMELCANVAAGYAATPDLSREQALNALVKLVGSLRRDQHDPNLSAMGLLGNFLDLGSGKRLGPLASDLEKDKVIAAFGPEKADAIWRALTEKGWITPRNNDREAVIVRGPKYGSEFFDGPLDPYSDRATRLKIMAILDQRVVMVVFGDNANLSASVAKTIGALLVSELKENSVAGQIRRELEQFLDAQSGGYIHLYDPKVGLFYFGLDATRNRLFGWEDLDGNWKIGHVDYLVNEFRAPATFVVFRFGFPMDAIKNLGLTMKPYRMIDGRDLYTLAPWEGSAFQAMGLGLWLGELENPSWRTLMQNFVAIEIDVAKRLGLPGFLSESYTGRGVEYTGSVGVAEIAVTPKPQIADAASLYTLGTAYAIAPAKIEKFLADNWAIVSKLFTDHGPWEGYNISSKKVISFQTTAHTLSLVLGFIGSGSEHMKRYLDSKNLSHRLMESYPFGDAVDLLADGMEVLAWSDQKADVKSNRENNALLVKGDRAARLGIAFVTPRPEGLNLSGGAMTIGYRSTQPLDLAIITFKPANPNSSKNPALIAKQLFTHLSSAAASPSELSVILPATPGLTNIKEVVITHESKTAQPVDLVIESFTVKPMGPARLEKSSFGMVESRSSEPTEQMKINPQ
jgi:hypothetical protein